MKILFYIILATILISATYLAMIFPGFKRKRKTDPGLLTPYAHRGLHDSSIPENSLAAFRKAVEAGYGIELDIQLSADGEVMVFHDYSLERLTKEKGCIKDKTASELRSIKLLDSEEHIPTLSEVLETVSGEVPLLIELKGESTNTDVCVAANKLLSEYSGPYCIESFNPLLVSWYRKNSPAVMRGQLYTNFCAQKYFSVLSVILSLMVFNFLAKPDFIAYDIRYVSAIPVKLSTGLFHAKKFTWTIRSEDDLNTASKQNSYPIFEGKLSL